MANYATNYGGGGEESTGSSRSLVSENLNAVESGVDTAIDGTKDVVREFRGKAQEVTDAMLDRVNRSWQQQRPRIEAYMNAHPWVVFGGLILLAYFLSGNQRADRSVNYR